MSHLPFIGCEPVGGGTLVWCIGQCDVRPAVTFPAAE